MMQRMLVTGLLVLGLGASLGSAGEVVGWRTDGTGRYPRANPPREWGPDKNVVWKTPLPKFSNASPVIVGDKILVCSEPCVLLCLSLADGKILWQKETGYKDLTLSEEMQKQLAVEQKQTEELNKEQRELEKEISAVRKQVTGGSLKKEDGDKKVAKLRAGIEELKAKKKALPLASRYTEPGKNSTGGVSMCTPATDGERVFVGYGNGLVARYDLEGNRQWLRLIEHSTASYGHAASPVLVGDTLLVHYEDLVALDTKDGSERWRVKMPPNHGTPIATRIGGVDVIITPTGNLVRVSDGKILASKLGSCGPNSPIIEGGIVYLVSGSAQAVRLPQSLTGEVECEPLWKARLKGGDYWFSSPVLHEGLIYVINGNGNFSVLDAKTGELVHTDRLEFGGGRVYPSIALAGGLLFISSDNGNTLVMEPGKEPRVVARNRLETFRTSPVFQGDRMYVRTQDHLYCIGK